jgi:periplasmic mercuric ion binding protein
MKSIYKLLFLICLLVNSNLKPVAAQEFYSEAKIKTSSVCNMCKYTIEKALAFERGIKTAVLDVNTQIVTVVYHKHKTSLPKIRKAIANVGYDADEEKANAKAYENLKDCCKKDNPIHE